MLGFRATQRLPFIVATALLAAVASIAVVGGFFEPFNVTYDHRALIIGGKRRMLISAGVHYPRATPEIEEIVDVRITKTRNGEHKRFLIKWKDRPLTDCTWMNARDLNQRNPELFQKALKAFSSGDEVFQPGGN